MVFKPGSTFSYAGTVPGLQEGINWAARASVKEPIKGDLLEELEVTLAQAPDYSTTKNWSILIFAPASETAKWASKLTAAKELRGDICFYDADNPDPVIYTRDFVIPLAQRITE
jgi:hypothetical protein